DFQWRSWGGTRCAIACRCPLWFIFLALWPILLRLFFWISLVFLSIILACDAGGFLGSISAYGSWLLLSRLVIRIVALLISLLGSLLGTVVLGKGIQRPQPEHDRDGDEHHRETAQRQRGGGSSCAGAGPSISGLASVVP